MTKRNDPRHVVVDGSNIATEGRSKPSLAQLHEAVMSFMEEHPDAAVTVVVDATFGHRIDSSESKEFEEGIANNELVAPPAGAVGRGDAFVLGIADKAGSIVVSNDSFQEFHGEYKWLFDEGRLIGGKPVPHVGWVWVPRNPVRGPVSRKATRAAGGAKSKRTSGSRRASKAASEPMPVPSEPPPGTAPKPARKRTAAPRGGDSVNELVPFLDFVEHHPVGTSLNGTVDAYSSHGVYVTAHDAEVRAYVPLKNIADPPPTSAKRIMKLGESVTLVVVSYSPARRSIDCAVPEMADLAIQRAADEAERAEDESSGGPEVPDGDGSTEEPGAAETTPAKKRTAKKTAAKKRTAKKTPAKKSAAKTTAAKKRTTKKAAAKTTAAKKRTAKKSAAKKTSARKTTAKKSAAKRSTGRKAATDVTAERPEEPAGEVG